MTIGPPLLLGTVLLAGLGLLAAALGRRILAWSAIDTGGAVERGILALGLGLGALPAIPFALWAAGVGTPLTVRWCVAALAALLAVGAVAVVRAAWRWAAVRTGRPGWESFLFSVFGLLLASIYVRAVCPVTDIDALLYHLTIPRRFLEAGRFVHLVTITPANWPLGVESLFGILLSFDWEAPIATVQFLFGALTIVTVYVHGRHVGGRLTGATAISILLLQWMFWWEMATGYIDLGQTAFAALMVYALQRSQDARADAGRWEWLAAVFAGCAAATKFQGFWVIAAFFVLVLLEHRGDPPARRVWRAVRLAAVASVIVAPWYLRTWAVTGNPVYPMLYSVFGGAEWTTEGWRKYVESYVVTDALATGLEPTPVVVYTTYALRILAGLLVAMAVVRATRESPVRLPARFAACFMVGILAGSAFNMRFLLAALPAFAVAVAWPLQRWKAHLVPVLCPVALVLSVWIGIAKVAPDLPTAARAAMGQMSRDEYYLADRTITDYEVARFANQTLPRDARILLCLQREHTALYAAEAYWANYRLQDSIHYDSMERLIADLRRVGITHLVIDPGFSQWYGSHPAWKVRKEVELPALERVAREYGTKLFESRGVSLYRLALPDRQASLSRNGGPGSTLRTTTPRRREALD